MKKLLALIMVTGMLMLAACGGSTSSQAPSQAPDNGGGEPTVQADPEPAGEEPAEQEPEETAPANNDLSFGDTFEFDDLEITFHDAFEWTVIDNQYSDFNGSDAFTVAMTVKNISDDTHGLNMFYYTQYGSKGTQLDSVSAYVDDVSFAGDMRSGAEMETVMAFLYDGDGDYYVEFATFLGDKIEVRIPVTK